MLRRHGASAAETSAKASDRICPFLMLPQLCYIKPKLAAMAGKPQLPASAEVESWRHARQNLIGGSSRSLMDRRGVEACNRAAAKPVLHLHR